MRGENSIWGGRGRAGSRGVTLIELMVALIVLGIIAALAVPSFTDFRQRSALAGAADQVQSFWAEARFEALKRNELVKVGFVSSGENFCVGAETTNDPGDDDACDCLTAGSCNVAVFPADQGAWQGVRIASATPTTLGGAAAASGAVVIDPKRANLTESADAGNIALRSPAGPGGEYQLSVAIDRNGRAFICEPAAAPRKIPKYADRQCAAP